MFLLSVSLFLFILVSFLLCSFLALFLFPFLFLPRHLSFSSGSLSSIWSQELWPGVCVSHATVSVPFALSCIWYLCRGSRVSPGFSHPRYLPLLLSFPLTLSSSRPLHLSVLLYTHCEDLGNEVDPPPRPTIHRVLHSTPLPPLSPFPPPAAAKSLAGLLRRQKFNIAVTLRWLYVLTVSSLCSDNVLLSKSDSAKRRLSGRVDSSSWRIHESGE